MAEESGSIRVVVSLGGYARSWRAEFDLDAGVIVRAGDLARVGAEPITPAALARLRARARRAHAQGPLRVREQFATAARASS
ncbi:MAG: hypothetical protein H6713_40475 [Myxococcales bacterium]|nr:hypothetical protein [Myxococcales bacterium]